MLMDWCGKDLVQDIQDRKARNDPYSEDEFLLIARSLISVLAEAERLGIAHRDINPQNVLYHRERRRVAIGDFGSSSEELKAGEQEATIVGTPLYMSDELKRGLVNNYLRTFHNMIKSDVYSLGATLITMATLTPPAWLIRAGDKDAFLQSELRRLAYSDTVKTLIATMMATSAQERPGFQQLESMHVLSDQSLVSLVSSADVCSAEPQCAGCRQEFQQAELGMTLLNCVCGVSQFCSQACFHTYVETATCGFVKDPVPCPSCAKPLSSNDIIHLCGGETKYREMAKNYSRKQLTCTRCKRNRANFFMKCGHIFCQKCIKAEELKHNNPPFFCEHCSFPSDSAQKLTEESMFFRIIRLRFCSSSD